MAPFAPQPLVRVSSKKYFFKLCFIFFVFMYMDRGQRTTCRSQFSPSTYEGTQVIKRQDLLRHFASPGMLDIAYLLTALDTGDIKRQLADSFLMLFSSLKTVRSWTVVDRYQRKDTPSHQERG